jgi:hypothetical protein
VTGGEQTLPTIPDYDFGWVEVGDYGGHALILRGHNLDAKTTRFVAEKEQLDHPQSVEVYWHEHRRVMWCERIDGFGCDQNGEWHRHWSEVKPNADPGCHFTVLYDAEAQS